MLYAFQSLPLNTQAELDKAWSVYLRVQDAEAGRVGQTKRRVAVLDPVEDICEIRGETGADSFGHSRLLANGHIDVSAPQPAYRAALLIRVFADPYGAKACVGRFGVGKDVESSTLSGRAFADAARPNHAQMHREGDALISPDDRIAVSKKALAKLGAGPLHEIAWQSARVTKAPRGVPAAEQVIEPVSIVAPNGQLIIPVAIERMPAIKDGRSKIEVKVIGIGG